MSTNVKLTVSLVVCIEFWELLSDFVLHKLIKFLNQVGRAERFVVGAFVGVTSYKSYKVQLYQYYVKPFHKLIIRVSPDVKKGPESSGPFLFHTFLFLQSLPCVPITIINLSLTIQL
jgi:hypothetical protein